MVHLKRYQGYTGFHGKDLGEMFWGEEILDQKFWLRKEGWVENLLMNGGLQMHLNDFWFGDTVFRYELILPRHLPQCGFVT